MKLGPFGKMDLPLPPPPLFMDAIDDFRELPKAPYYIETCNNPFPVDLQAQRGTSLLRIICVTWLKSTSVVDYDVSDFA